MNLKIKVDSGGNAYVAAIDPTTGEHRKAATVRPDQELELTITDLVSAGQIGFGDIVDSDSSAVVEETPGDGQPQEPADKPGGGDEGSAAAGQDQGQPAEGQGQQPPSGQPVGEQGGGTAEGEGDQETPTTSAASEKPLYLIEGDEVADGFELSGLETPDGKSLYHFAGDTAGQTATGNRDGVSVYADADDNDQPVQPAAENTAENGAGQEQQQAA